jgi:hypothetical protein
LPFWPDHDWYHALDPDSYILSDISERPGKAWPNCKEPSCGNYYRLYQTLNCPAMAEELNYEIDGYFNKLKRYVRFGALAV